MQEQNLATSVNHDRPMTANGYLGEQAKQANSIRRIAIEQLNHGYIVSVGCQTFAIESPSTLIAKLAEYINNPTDTEVKWERGQLF